MLPLPRPASRCGARVTAEDSSHTSRPNGASYRVRGVLLAHMGKITITLQPEIDRRAVDRVRLALSRIGTDEEITITIESADAHQADPIIEVLDENGFDYQAKGSHDGKSYHINARRKMH